MLVIGWKLWFYYFYFICGVNGWYGLGFVCMSYMMLVIVRVNYSVEEVGWGVFLS